MAYTIGEVAKLAGVTIRLLRHYDNIGLLAAAGRSEAGYRIYDDAALEQLQEILFFRELGFALDEIKAIRDDPSADRTAVLVRQHELVGERIVRLDAIRDAIERAIQTDLTGVGMTKEEMFEVFGDFDPSEHTAEAEARWGDTSQFAESRRRTAAYDKSDWAAARAEADEIAGSLARLMASGEAPTGSPAMDAAEAHRVHIDRWYYPCPPQVHVGLADMYVADVRFATWWDEFGDGLPGFVRQAIRANAAR